MSRGVRLAIQGAGMARHLDIDHDTTLGRARDAGVCLPLPFVSSRHLRIYCDKTRWYVEELGSTNGTMCNGRPLRPGVPHPISDTIQLTIDQLQLTLAPLDAPMQLTQSLSTSFSMDLAACLNVPHTHAYLESKSGPGRGHRLVLEGQPQIWLRSEGVTLDLSPTPTEFAIEQDGTGFFFTEPNRERRKLRNGERLDLFGIPHVFVDPLEEHFDVPSEPMAAVPDTPTAAAQHDEKKPPWLALLLIGAVAVSALIILGVMLV